MIYKKEANFPYPVLTPQSNSYMGCELYLNIELKDDSENFRFYVRYDLECEFLQSLLENDKAELILVIQSKDNKFYKLKEEYVDIKKSRISLSKRTSIQLLIKAKDKINFANNMELSEFYSEFKEEIEVDKNSVLAFSNVCIFEGSLRKPLELFDKRLDPDLKSDIKFDIGSETIIISFKSAEFQFGGIRHSQTLNNTYIYMGLQKALYKFIQIHGGEDEVVYLDEINPPENGLDFKLYNLMKSKMVEEINSDNIDEVIYKITDKVIEKHVLAIKGLCADGN